MNRASFAGVVLMCALCTGGCSQSDGPLPVADGEVPNRIEDLARDLQNVAGKSAGAETDLSDDLKVFTEPKPAANAAIDALSRACAEALSGRSLDQPAATVLARQLWLVVAGRELSEKQVESLGGDVRAAAVSAGATPETSGSLAAQARAVQAAVTDRQRRWYEVF